MDATLRRQQGIDFQTAQAARLDSDDEGGAINEQFGPLRPMIQ